MRALQHDAVVVVHDLRAGDMFLMAAALRVVQVVHGGCWGLASLAWVPTTVEPVYMPAQAVENVVSGVSGEALSAEVIAVCRRKWEDRVSAQIQNAGPATLNMVTAGSIPRRQPIRDRVVVISGNQQGHMTSASRFTRHAFSVLVDPLCATPSALLLRDQTVSVHLWVVGQCEEYEDEVSRARSRRDVHRQLTFPDRACHANLLPQCISKRASGAC